MNTLLPCLSKWLEARGSQSHRTNVTHLPRAIVTDIQGRKMFKLQQVFMIMKYILESLR